MRLLVLAGGWAGFNDAAYARLAELGVELMVVHEASEADTDYADQAVARVARHVTWDGSPDVDALLAQVRDFAPDVVHMVSWHFAPYRTVVQSLPAGTLRVLSMDNVWRNIPKQWVGRAVAPFWVRRLFDCVMVPSDRTEFFARRLGFGEGDVVRGSLSADTSLFGSPARTGEELAGRRRFLTCSRLVHHKGADVLAEAYATYRRRVDDPWDLVVAGQGPLASSFDGVPGVELLGFRQPAEVAQLMREAACVVVPSREEPYGVTLHEAALSGCPIISTYFVGAVPSFLQDGQNGWTVPRSDADALAVAMARMSALPPARLASMSDVSRALGRRLDTDGWASNMLEQMQWRLADLRGA